MLTAFTLSLSDPFPTYSPHVAPELSIHDLSKVVFARSSVMLKEHFRCVSPIIEYSRRDFYTPELQPLGIPRASGRLSACRSSGT